MAPKHGDGNQVLCERTGVKCFQIGKRELRGVRERPICGLLVRQPERHERVLELNASGARMLQRAFEPDARHDLIANERLLEFLEGLCGLVCRRRRHQPSADPVPFA